MNKRIIGLGIIIIILCSITETGCGRQEEHKENPERNEQEEEVRFSYSKQKVGDDTIVSIGSLAITLPEGWRIETRQEGELTQFVLEDNNISSIYGEIQTYQAGYHHEIVITPYEIPQMPEDTLQLAATMKEHFPVPVLYGIKGTGKTEEIWGCWMYGEDRDKEEKEYFLFSQKGSMKEDPEGRELFHVRESSIYAYQNEVESFGDFLDKGLIQIDGAPAVDHSRSVDYGNRMEYYYWFNRKTEKPLFAVIRKSVPNPEREGVITVYQKGNYETPVTALPMRKLEPDRIGIVDINKDGNEDFVCDYRLLNPLNSLASAKEEDFDGYLWDEDQKTFLYTAGDVMLAGYGDLWERTNSPKSQRGSEMIPEGLITYISEHLLGSREDIREAMLPLVSDYELTLERVRGIAGDDIAIKNEILSIVTYDGAGTWIWVDADNDGIEDIYLSEYLGGSLGHVYNYLFTGRDDGSYELTDVLEELQMEFAFIEWRGKNYLAKTTYNLSKKVYNGISLECYEDGSYQGGIRLAITPKEGEDCRKIETPYIKEEKYRSLEKNLLEFAKEYHVDDRVEPGTAETEHDGEEYQRSCDLDNDGEEEKYNLSFWMTTNYYTVDHIIIDIEEEEISDRVWQMINEEEMKGIPMNLWVDETEYGNVIFILYEDGVYDFHICGWLMSEKSEEKLIQVDCQVQTEVTKEILSKEPGKTLH